jgi:hypothetical protein
MLLIIKGVKPESDGEKQENQRKWRILPSYD